MTDDRSNSASTVSAHLARAREHYARGLECYVMAAEEIDAALAVNPDLGFHDIGREMDVAHTTVKRLYDWWKAGADRTDTPFGGEDARTARLARAGRQVIREQPGLIITEMLKDPKATRRMIRDLQKGLEALKPKEAADPPPPPKQHLFIFLRDHIVMGEHILFVGTSGNSFYKSYLLEHLGALGTVPEGAVNWDRVETDTVVVTDPPYGQGEPGVPGDDSADHSGVYSLLRPRGGFSFCAFRPPLFFEAEKGITSKYVGGTPVHYLAMMTKSAHGQGPDGRVRNVLQTIIYWERRGEQPWIKGRSTVSVLEADEQAREEMRMMREHHTTPKPVNVMEDLIDLVTEPGDFVLDPFTGSGSTLIACERTGRRFIGFEANGMNDPNEKKWHAYAEVAVQRWQDETGRKAVVHRSYANPPTMLFDDLKANGGWADVPTETSIELTG